ncbi:MAG: thioesterase [Rhodospirillaceae bacterium]|nr:thioesterase [Rhodospirillaceae bacterium]|tara:strand:+ start:1826 stop:2245 length:420 start_codon:yes stop_codon:yes gene_type:complete
MTSVLSQNEVQRLLDDSPYIGFMKLEVVSMDVDKDQIVIRMPMRPEFERRRGTGQYHGGAIAALIDIAGDYALVMKVGGGVPTINFRVDFLRPGTNTSLTATATTRRQGRSVAVVDIDIHDDDGKLCAVGRGTYSPKVG